MLCFTIVYVPCGDCDGHGQVAHPRMTEALRACHRTRWRSTASIAAEMGIGSTNCCNLMKRLHSMKLVDRRGTGSRYAPYEWRVRL